MVTFHESCWYCVFVDCFIYGRCFPCTCGLHCRLVDSMTDVWHVLCIYFFMCGLCVWCVDRVMNRPCVWCVGGVCSGLWSEYTVRRNDKLQPGDHKADAWCFCIAWQWKHPVVLLLLVKQKCSSQNMWWSLVEISWRCLEKCIGVLWLFEPKNLSLLVTSI